MDLTKLFKAQKELDERIVKEKGLEGQDLLDKKILALQVELGELANEWRGFKFWSNDQDPRDWAPNEKDICESCNGEPIFIENSKIVGQCKNCDGCGVHFHNPLLEEYVDCLHFILSIGLEIKEIQNKPVENFNYYSFKNPFGITQAFTDLMREFPLTVIDDEEGLYIRLFCEFIGLGEMLGFTWEEVEQAYLSKNKINHERQEQGY